MVLNLAYHNNKLYETWEYWSRNMRNFDLLEKGLKIVSSSHFIKYLENEQKFQGEIKSIFHHF